MQILYYPQRIQTKNNVIILGDFDGVHLAHKAVIENGVNYAKKNGFSSVILMFENNTKNAKIITNNLQKLSLFERMDVDCVYIREFTKDFMHQSAEEFVEFLKDTMDMCAVSIGFDYRFGYQAKGDTRTLKELGKKLSFDALITEAIELEGHIISSTYIRHLISEGDVEKAKKFLGRSYFLQGKVEKGFQNGTKLGFPTANLSYDGNIILPQSGVYAGFCEVLGKIYEAVINVGNNPTFYGKKITVETHILGFFQDIYGEEIKVFFEKGIRADKKFENIDMLKGQINEDIKEAKGFFGRMEEYV